MYYIIKGSWEAILPCYGQNRIVRLDLDEGWCETLHYITIITKELTLIKGGVRLYTT